MHHITVVDKDTVWLGVVGTEPQHITLPAQIVYMVCSYVSPTDTTPAAKWCHTVCNSAEFIRHWLVGKSSYPPAAPSHKWRDMHEAYTKQAFPLMCRSRLDLSIIKLIQTHPGPEINSNNIVYSCGNNGLFNVIVSCWDRVREDQKLLTMLYISKGRVTDVVQLATLLMARNPRLALECQHIINILTGQPLVGYILYNKLRPLIYNYDLVDFYRAHFADLYDQAAYNDTVRHEALNIQALIWSLVPSMHQEHINKLMQGALIYYYAMSIEELVVKIYPRLPFLDMFAYHPNGQIMPLVIAMRKHYTDNDIMQVVTYIIEQQYDGSLVTPVWEVLDTLLLGNDGLSARLIAQYQKWYTPVTLYIRCLRLGIHEGYRLRSFDRVMMPKGYNIFMSRDRENNQVGRPIQMIPNTGLATLTDPVQYITRGPGSGLLEDATTWLRFVYVTVQCTEEQLYELLT